MDNENCSTRTSIQLSKLGMVSMEAVFDPGGIYSDTLTTESMNPTFGENLWFKIKYRDALTWLSEYYNCNILIYQEYPDINDLWKVRILPGGPVFKGGFTLPIENSWSLVAEVSISTVCTNLLDYKEYYDGAVKYKVI